jgi:hypothetical protein
MARRRRDRESDPAVADFAPRSEVLQPLAQYKAVQVPLLGS